MIYYIINIMLSFLAAFECLHVKARKILNVSFYSWIVFLILLAGTRLVGFDYDVYKTIFSYASDGNFWNAGVEIGFGLINYLFSFWGFNVFLLFVALVAVSTFAIFFKKYSPYLFLSLLLYFSTFFIVKEMGQMRQGLAMAIACIAMTAAFDKKKKVFYAVSLVAFSIHYSAIVIFPVYYICNHIYSTLKIMVILLLSSIFLVINLNTFLSAILSLVPLTAIQNKAASVLLSSVSAQKVGINSSLILRLVILVIMLFFRRQLSNTYWFFDQMLMLYFYGVILYLVFNSISEFAQRTSVYFRLLEVIIIPCVLSLIRQRSARLAILFILVLNSFISINRLFGSNNGYEAYNPYNSYLFDWI